MHKPTEQETKQGYQECKCGKLFLLESGFEVNPYFCKECECFAATKEEFFSVPVDGYPKVLNKYKDNPTENSIYIGRPGKWGNPFEIGKHGTREEVILKYREYLINNYDLKKQVRKELSGRDLVCFCSPLPCHGDILLRVANDISIEILSK